MGTGRLSGAAFYGSRTNRVSLECNVSTRKFSRLRRRVVSLALLLLTLSAAHGQEGDRHAFERAIVPSSGRATSEFIPKGWALEDEVSGDLNSDSLHDVVLCLVEDRPSENEEGPLDRYRGIVILFRSADGTFRRAATSGTLLRCTMCGGVLSSPYPVGGLVTIRSGVLIAEQLYGSREARSVTQRFRYDSHDGRFYLIGEDISDVDRVTGDFTSTSTNYLTGKQTVETGGYDARKDKRVVRSKKTRRVARKKIPIEEIDFDDY